MTSIQEDVGKEHSSSERTESLVSPELGLAGCELDAAVAERVMGLNVLGEAICLPNPECGYLEIPYEISAHGELRPVYLKACQCESKQETDADYFGHIGPCLEVVRFYSTDINAALDTVNRLMSQGWQVDIIGENDVLRWYVCFDNRIGERVVLGQGGAETLPEAICRAALRAVAHSVPAAGGITTIR